MRMPPSVFVFFAWTAMISHGWGQTAPPQTLWQKARDRGAIYEDCQQNATRILRGWIENHCDPQTCLYSRGKKWDYHNEAADHYSSLVLIAHYVDPSLIEPGGTLHRTLANSVRLCATPSGIPRLYDLKNHRAGRMATLGELAEWLRDGTVRICELLGVHNDWYREMVRLTDAMIAEAGRRGGMAAAFPDDESAGSMLQTLARLYAWSGDAKYLVAAEELADPWLLKPRELSNRSVFLDHGCELIPGLGELFVVESHAGRPRARSYRQPLQSVLDAVLSRNVDPQTGLFRSKGSLPADTWGYVLFAYENFDRATGATRYKDQIEKPLRWLIANYRDYDKLKTTLWPSSKSSDDWSDSYESAIVLLNRYPAVPDGFNFLDWMTLQHIHRRGASNGTGGPKSPYTGGHFDGSTGRCLIIHSLLCSQNVRHLPATARVRLGGVRQGAALYLTLEAGENWSGRLVFDGPRTEGKGATIDWARINEMPQWFVVRPERKFSVSIDGRAATMTGRQLLDGLAVSVVPGQTRRIQVVAQQP